MFVLLKFVLIAVLVFVSGLSSAEHREATHEELAENLLSLRTSMVNSVLHQQEYFTDVLDVAHIQLDMLHQFTHMEEYADVYSVGRDLLTEQQNGIAQETKLHLLSLQRESRDMREALVRGQAAETLAFAKLQKVAREWPLGVDPLLTQSVMTTRQLLAWKLTAWGRIVSLNREFADLLDLVVQLGLEEGHLEEVHDEILKAIELIPQMALDFRMSFGDLQKMQAYQMGLVELQAEQARCQGLLGGI